MVNDTTTFTGATEVHPDDTALPITSAVTPSELELLVLLIEECGEVIQAASKVLRHGWQSRNPTGGVQAVTNEEDLQTEVGQLQAVIDLLTDSGDLPARALAAARARKHASVVYYLHHQPELGRGASR